MQFDYIVVGAGSAGCILANRLSFDRSVSVCLVEAGPPDTAPSIHTPFRMLDLMRSPKYNWCYVSEPQPHLYGRRIYMPRGKTLGGTSSINGMIYTRGHSSDYDHWAQLGNKGWAYADLLPYFIKAENFEPGYDPAYHGVGGPLSVTNLRSPNPFCDVFIQAGEEIGLVRNCDFNGAHQDGVGLFHVTMKDGRRCSTATAYLRQAEDRPNLTILTDARVTRVVLVDGRASGVELSRQGRLDAIAARREVIVAAGSINSPHLLMLSGIGPVEQLKRHGIQVLHPLPGVGQNLQDHFDIKIIHKARRPISYGLTLSLFLKLPRSVREYRQRGTGILSSNVTEAGGFARSGPGLPAPDIQFHLSLAKVDGDATNLWSAMGHGYTLHIGDLRPRSRGYIGLASSDPLRAPLIQPNYLSHADDLERMIELLKVGRRLLAAKAFAPYRGRELLPGSQVQQDSEIREFIRRKADTSYHPVGTCRMGDDKDAVVDHRLRIHGVSRMRVVDASIMPTLIGGNTLATTVAIAEKAADMILEDSSVE